MCIALLLISISAVALHAHQQKEAYTTVLLNARTGNLEVSHRFFIHDAEHALKHLLGGEADILQNAETQHAFAEYIKQRFFLRDGLGHTLNLQDVGYEVEGKYFWVYQEIAIPKRLLSIRVKMDALQDVWLLQVNHVNVEKAGVTRSVRLNKNDGWETIFLEAQNN